MAKDFVSYRDGSFSEHRAGTVRAYRERHAGEVVLVRGGEVVGLSAIDGGDALARIEARLDSLEQRMDEFVEEFLEE